MISLECREGDAAYYLRALEEYDASMTRDGGQIHPDSELYMSTMEKFEQKDSSDGFVNLTINENDYLSRALEFCKWR